jgi:hypothetical protein
MAAASTSAAVPVPAAPVANPKYQSAICRISKLHSKWDLHAMTTRQATDMWEAFQAYLDNEERSYAVFKDGAALGEENLTLKEVWHEIRHRPAEETGVYYEGTVGLVGNREWVWLEDEVTDQVPGMLTINGGDWQTRVNEIGLYKKGMIFPLRQEQTLALQQHVACVAGKVSVAVAIYGTCSAASLSTA